MAREAPPGEGLHREGNRPRPRFILSRRDDEDVLSESICFRLSDAVGDDAEDPKNFHLRELEGAKERLTLCRADLLDYDSLRNAIHGCDGVFHIASPVTDDPVSAADPNLMLLRGENPKKKKLMMMVLALVAWSSQEKMVDPSVQGTRFVIQAAAEAGARRVVFTSSIGAVNMNPNRPPETVVDESCWSDLEFCKATKNWYCYGKAVAEQEAWRCAEQMKIDLAVVIPVLVMGPLLQPKINASTVHVLKYLTGSAKTYANSVQAYVDVRDVAAAHVVVYEAPSAAGRRFLCAESVLHRAEVVDILGNLFPGYPVPTK